MLGGAFGVVSTPPPHPLLAKASVGPRGRHTIDLRRPLRRPALPAGGAAAARGGPWRPVARRAATNVVRTTMVRHQHLSPPTAHAAAVFPWSVPRPGLLGAAATPPLWGRRVAPSVGVRTSPSTRDHDLAVGGCSRRQSPGPGATDYC